jgi:hypothetical protein
VPAVAESMQKKAAAAFFASLGISYVPWNVSSRIRSMDAYYAIAVSCEELGISFQHLLTPSNPDHEDQRAILTKCVDVLLAAEAAARGTPLPMHPIITALNVSIDAGEAQVDRLEKARLAWQSLEKTPIFSKPQEYFKKSAQDQLSTWHELSDDVLTDLVITWTVFEELHTRLVNAKEAIARSLEVLGHSGDNGLADVIRSAETERARLDAELWASVDTDIGELFTDLKN